ncbi:MAG: aspartate carbamoyltransferase [Candidatus Bathyarchaeota archaeon]|nr:MAG: aspartate carbamoyltransferase [Candidatus Bathyarchaeota archaeon]
MVDSASFKGRDIISMRDFSREEIDFILDTATGMMPLAEKGSDLLKGRVMAALFFEPSTRTRLSFESSMCRLGGSVIGFAEPKVSSVAKGESLADTIRTVENYSDVITMRHPSEDAAKIAADAASIPVINGGSGPWEHPTQALLDLHTIRTAKGTIDGLTIALAGDLLYGRTVHSLAVALRNYDVRCYFVSPELLRMRQDVIDDIEGNLDYTETEDLRGILPELDIVYATRIQKERFPDPADYERLKDSYLIDEAFLAGAKKDMKLMHPLPRVNEIATGVDATPHALYFKQMRHGIYVRMALLALVLGAL